MMLTPLEKWNGSRLLSD